MGERETVKLRVLSDDDYQRVCRSEPNYSRPATEWCPTCNGRGVYIARGGAKTACDCPTQHRLGKNYLAAGIGATYMRLDWDDYHGPKGILQGVEKYLDRHEAFLQRGMGLYFSGTFGTGKTMIANLVLKELIKRGQTCFATTFAQTIEMYTSTWRDKDEKAWFQRKFLDSQFLLLDDVGKELRGTRLALAETTFDAILRERVTHGRPTLITTNLAADELHEGYGGAILSLIREKSLEEVFEGEDFRPRANDRELDEIMKGWVRPIV
ncbi:DnaC-like helicase loader [Mycobacterium phage Pleione]|uniref:DnaC-like helicase loader n=1 Tax=Mycobacterium phage Pleione TaxID=1079895 RepID=G3M529_9CAUD|nr:DnaC-like helicase loader [Mycobacterium phage Pleione]AEN79792.1 DnaC-like helicase loader [Mycobacterium phage Pleione]